MTRAQQIVGHRPRRLDALELEGDGVGLEDPDPDRQEEVLVRLLEDHDRGVGDGIEDQPPDLDLEWCRPASGLLAHNANVRRTAVMSSRGDGWPLGRSVARTPSRACAVAPVTIDACDLAGALIPFHAGKFTTRLSSPLPARVGSPLGRVRRPAPPRDGR